MKRAALIACTTGAVSFLISTGIEVQSLAGLQASHAPRWVVPVAVLGALFSATLPVFYFALYRNDGTLRISRSMQLLALTAALALGFNLAAGLPQSIASLRHVGTSTVLAPETGWTASDISVVLGILSDAAGIFLMIAIYRQNEAELDESVPVSKFLRAVTGIAVVVWGIWVAFHACRLALVPYTYATLRDLAAQSGRTATPLTALISDAARSLLSQAALFAGPFIIWRSSGRTPGVQTSAEGPSETSLSADFSDVDSTNP